MRSGRAVVCSLAVASTLVILGASFGAAAQTAASRGGGGASESPRRPGCDQSDSDPRCREQLQRTGAKDGVDEGDERSDEDERDEGEALGRTREELGVPERREYSDYEVETIDLMLEEVGGRIDRHPEGKHIESVEVVTLDFIEKRDPVPTFFNVFHATSRQYVIERELLLREGHHWDWRRIDESERNLRALRQLSVVLILPIESEREDHVRMLVVTKDLLSLRLNWDIALVDGELTYFFAQPSEENVFGLHKTVNTLFIYEPDTISVGGGYFDRRFWGSRVQWAGSLGAIVNHRTGATEGSFGRLSWGKPLYSTKTRWGWGTLVTWHNEVARVFSGTNQRFFSADDEDPVSLVVGTTLPGQVGGPTPDDNVPFEYDVRFLTWQTSASRSWGYPDKTNLEWGLEAVRRRFSVGRLRDYDPAAVAAFEDEQVPSSNVRIGPFVELRAFSTDYLRALDFERLGLQEDLQLGHVAALKVYAASKQAMGTRDLVGIFSALSYTFPIGNGIWRFYGSNRIELAGSVDESHAEVEAGTRLVTPTLGIGRFVYDGGVLHRYRNYLNLRTSLGGDGRLRGYKANAAFRGKDAAVSNLEFRTRGIQIFSLQAGMAAFWDAGHAVDGFGNLRLRHGVGFGIRGFFPQIDSIVGRLDVAFPLSPHTPQEANNFSIVATFGQAFGVPQVSSSGPVL